MGLVAGVVLVCLVGLSLQLWIARRQPYRTVFVTGEDPDFTGEDYEKDMIAVFLP